MNIEIDKIVKHCMANTMLSEDRLRANISLMIKFRDKGLLSKGVIVECGVWKGGMALASVRVFGNNHKYIFFDSFAGLPAPNERDGEDAKWWAAHTDHPRYFDNCKVCYNEVCNTFDEYKNNDFNIQIIKGWFADTLKITPFEPIIFAHIDCDWYDSVYLSLERLWPKMAVGGIIIIDDYYDWEGCRRAVHDFFSKVQAREAIESIGSSGGVFIRRLGPWELSESPHLQ